MAQLIRDSEGQRVVFPYADVADLAIGAEIEVDFLGSEPSAADAGASIDIVRRALEEPIGTSRLRDLAQGKSRVLVVFDDNTRPTPVADFIDAVLEEFAYAGVPDHAITFIAALGTHRPMTHPEIVEKLGTQVVERFRCINHEWDNDEALVYLGETEQGAPVWINKIVSESDLVLGIGAVMPIDIAGFTGGGKILVPGLSGPETVNKMHWSRVSLPSDEVVGKADNPVRDSIDALARKAGLNMIVNVVLDEENNVIDAVCGDLTEAHREGCRRALRQSAVEFGEEYDIVVADSFPFDIEFWQANKALDTAGRFVRPGGIIILVTPCPEGWSQTHREDLLTHGYPSREKIIELVEGGRLSHSVVGVHMYQVSEAAVDKGELVIVSSGLPPEEVAQMGFRFAATPKEALEFAVSKLGAECRIAVLKQASRMIPIAKTKVG
jgi:lactate racemase